jgi:UDP-N-acetylglucosamine diphosphorylase/glucosamine-1-phosphate N-acetyltransferase
MTLVLFDEERTWKNLLPLTFTRPTSEIRVGILSIKEKWALAMQATVGYMTQAYLQKKFPIIEGSVDYFVNGKILPNKAILEAIKSLKPNQALYNGEELLASTINVFDQDNFAEVERVSFQGHYMAINHLVDIFQKNAEALQLDFEQITANRESLPLSKTVTVIGNPDLIFLEPGAKVEACVLNTMGGPIYIGVEAEIMEASAIRGPFALGDHSTIKLSTKIYGATTVGPHCKVGGEVSNSVIFGYSNKGHDGFLGNSVVGEWCNFGADSNNSNLKNNYGNVKLFNYREDKMLDTGLQFCGLMMADHSKCGINTMFNTGTIVGVGANIYGGGFPPTHVKSFSWGGSEGFVTHQLDKLFETEDKVYARRGIRFDETEKELLLAVFQATR